MPIYPYPNQVNWPTGWDVSGGVSQFVQGFLDAANKEKARQRQLELDQLAKEQWDAEHKLQLQRLKMAQQQLQTQRMEKVREDILKRFKSLEEMNTPVETLAPGLQGPPAEVAGARAPITLPGYSDPVTGEVVPDTQLTPRYREDVLARARQEGDIESQLKLDLERQKLEMQEPYEAAADERRYRQALDVANVRAQDSVEAGEWVIDTQDNKVVYMPKRMLLESPPGRYVKYSQSMTGEGGKPLLATEASKIADFGSGLAAISRLSEVVEKTGAGSQLGAAIPDAISSLTGWGVDSKQRQAVLNQVKQVIGKAMEGGVLRKEDEVKYDRILPTIKDAPDVAVSKLRNLLRTMRDDSEVYLSTIEAAGRDVTKVRENLDRILKGVESKVEDELAPEVPRTDRQRRLDGLYGGGR